MSAKSKSSAPKTWFQIFLGDTTGKVISDLAELEDMTVSAYVRRLCEEKAKENLWRRGLFARSHNLSDKLLLKETV